MQRSRAPSSFNAWDAGMPDAGGPPDTEESPRVQRFNTGLTESEDDDFNDDFNDAAPEQGDAAPEQGDAAPGDGDDEEPDAVSMAMSSAGEDLAECLREEDKEARMTLIRLLSYKALLDILKWFFKGESRRGKKPALRARVTRLVETTLEKMHAEDMEVEDFIELLMERVDTENGAGAADDGGGGGSLRAAQQPRWKHSEHARLICCVLEPSMREQLDRIMTGETRATLDAVRAPGAKSAWEHIADMFNSEHAFTHPADGDDFTDELDPNDHTCQRTATTLKHKWGELKTEYTKVFSRWDKSGRGEAGREADISDFCQADTKYPGVIVFMHAAMGADPDMIAFGTRLVDACASFESGSSKRRSSLSPGGSEGKRVKGGQGALATASLDELAAVFGETDSDRALAAAAKVRAAAAKLAARAQMVNTLLSNRGALSAAEEAKLVSVLPGLIDALRDSDDQD